MLPADSRNTVRTSTANRWPTASPTLERHSLVGDSFCRRPSTHPPFRGFFGSVQEGLKGEKPARRSLGLATRRVASAGGGTSRPEGFCSFSVFSGRRRRRRRRRCCNGVFYHLPILSHIFFHTSLHHVRRVESKARGDERGEQQAERGSSSSSRLFSSTCPRISALEQDAVREHAAT